MKTRFLALAALVLGLASCQTEPEGLDVNVGGAVDTTITVSIPETETRAGGTNSALSVFENGILSAENVTMRYIMQVYYKNTESQAEPKVKYSDEKSVNFDVRLVPDRDYTFVVWADVVKKNDAGEWADWHYDTFNNETNRIDLANITVIDNEWVAMDESRDAFTVSEVVADYNGAKTIELKLKRPFAKLRVITTDMEALNDLQIAPVYATVEYKTAYRAAFNAFTSVAVAANDSDKKTHNVFQIADYADQTGANKVLFTDYFFAENGDAVSFVLNVYEDAAHQNLIKSNNFSTDIAVNRNYLTTIQGNILTDGNKIEVEVEDAFNNAGNLEEEPYYVEIWDGESIEEPTLVSDTTTGVAYYSVENGAELAWLAAAVSGTLPAETRATIPATSFANKTFKLEHDIDLGGNEWTPIGMGGKHFEGTFDGQGHTIKGLMVSKRHGAAQAALFCSLAGNATIKNVVIDEAYVKYPANCDDFYASAIAGTIYGTVTFENITVKNSTITGNNKVGAIFAHDGSSNKITVNNCHVDNCYIASEDLKDGGNVGGLIGLFQTGSTDACRISNSSVKNSIIIGINSSDSGKRANSEFIGGILSKDNTNLVLENCVVANNNFSETIDGTSPVTYSGEFDDKFIGGEREGVRKGVVVINGTRYEGNNEPKKVSAGDGKWYATISEAIAAGNNEISLGDGEFNTPAGLSNGQADNTLTIVGNGMDKTTVNGATNTNNQHPGNYAQDLDLVLENLTFVTTNNGYNGGFGHAKSVTFRNCKIVGQFYAHSGAPHYFYDCTIDPLTGYLYTYSSDCVFERCTFSASEGKALQIYADANTGEHTVTITDCEFVAAKQAQTWDGKPVTGIDINSNGAKFTVAINGCTATGFPAGLNSKSTLWNVKDGGKAHATVTVDGIQVWAAGYDKLANYPNIFTKDGNYYVFSVAGLQDLNNYFKANSMANSLWDHEYNIAADIDATGFTWDGVYVVVGNNGNNGIVLNGNNHTINNLTINNCLLCGNPCGSNEGVNPGLVKDITMKNVVVNGTSHDASVFWGNCYTNVNFENVTVDGAKINGGSNVGALVSRTTIDGPNTSINVNFKNCVVKNSTLEANNTEADPTGASGFIGRAYGNTKLTFENCSVENNTINNAEGLIGGAVYGYGVWANGGWAGLGACNSFTKFDGVTFTETSNIDETRNVTVGMNVTFTDDVEGDAVKGGYSVAGINHNGGVLDGNMNELTVNKANDDYGCAIYTNGGTIKNFAKIGGSFRGIFTAGLNDHLYVDNVVIEDVVYTFNSDDGNKKYGVYISNSTLNGWTSYSNVHKEVVFTNCTFGEGNGYKFCRPYNASRFVNCEFCEGYKIDPRHDNVVFVNCRVNGVLVTPANAVELLGSAASMLKFE